MYKTYMVRGVKCDEQEVYEKVVLALREDIQKLWQKNEELATDIEVCVLKMGGNEEYKAILEKFLPNVPKLSSLYYHQMLSSCDDEIRNKKISYILEWVNDEPVRMELMYTQKDIDKLKENPTLMYLNYASKQVANNSAYIKFLSYLQKKSTDFKIEQEKSKPREE